MTKVYAYLARIKDQEKDVIAVPDGAGRALCVSSDKHWTLTREWDELHIIAPLVEAARWGLAESERDFSGVDWKVMYSAMERERDDWRDKAYSASEGMRKATARAEDSEHYAQAVSDSNRDNADRALKAERERDDLRRQVEDLHKRRRKQTEERAAWTRNRRELISERDAAVARAEAAEKRHSWPKVTPTGHTYVEPRTYEALCHEHSNAAQADVECWAADECPPEPTWEMVGIAHREVERLQHERDEYRDGMHAAQRHHEKVEEHLVARAEAAEARTTPAVTREDVEQAIRGATDASYSTPNGGGFVLTRQDRAADAVWSLVSGDDPAVFVVRESDIAAVKVEQDEDGYWEADGDLVAMRQNTAEAIRGWSLGELQILARYEAVARAIEDEQAVDPVEAKAREWARVMWPEAHLPEGDGAVDALCRLIRHLDGQEAER